MVSNKRIPILTQFDPMFPGASNCFFFEVSYKFDICTRYTLGSPIVIAEL